MITTMALAKRARRNFIFNLLGRSTAPGMGADALEPTLPEERGRSGTSPS
jgi:hypothetical protein